MQAQDLNRFDLFFLPNCDHKGTTINTVYQVKEHTDDGIIAHGSLQSQYGSLNLDFYLPNWVEVELLPIEQAL